MTEILDPWHELLHPFPKDLFLSEYRFKQPLLLQGREPSRYAALFSPDEVAKLAQTAEDRFRARCRLMKPRQEVTLGPGPLTGQLRAAFADGFTIQINSLEEIAPSLLALRRAFEIEVDGDAHFNLYFSPRTSKVFPPHADHHEAVILQVQGTKHWQVFEDRPNLVPASLRREDPPSEEALGTPAISVVLHPGDLLYLPLGRFHAAETTDDSSLHLTLGLYPYNAGKLLLDVVGELSASDLDFLEPIAFWTPESASARISRLFEKLTANIDVADRVRRRRATDLAKRPILPFQVFADQRYEGLPTTRVEKRPGSACTVVRSGESVTLIYPEGALRGPERIEAAYRFIAETAGDFCAEDLTDALGIEARVLLIRRLIEGGLLVPLSTGRE